MTLDKLAKITELKARKDAGALVHRIHSSPDARTRTMTLRPLLLVLFTVALGAMEFSTADVTYQDGDLALTGFLATPATAAAAPGVLVVHEWWGNNDYSRRRAKELAEAGYVAFALDMYGTAPTTDFAKAAELSKPFYEDRALMLRRIRLGLDQLRQAKGVDQQRLAAIGFCFGGACVLGLARDGEDLAGVVSFHGGLRTSVKALPKTVKAPLLVLHGGADTFVPPAEVADFIEEMTAAQATWRMEVFGSAVHAFTNPAAGSDPAKGIAWDKDAEHRAFAAMYAFLEECFHR